MIGLLVVAAFVVPIAIAAVAFRLLYELGETGSVPTGLGFTGGLIIAGLVGLEAAAIQTLFEALGRYL